MAAVTTKKRTIANTTVKRSVRGTSQKNPAKAKKNIAGFIDGSGQFRPIRTPSFVGTPKRKAKASDKRKYSKAKAGDLGAHRQELALEDVFDKATRRSREDAAKEVKERERLVKQIENDIHGEADSRGKGRTLVQFVRAKGGIKPQRGKRGRLGDLENFSFKESGKRGLVNDKSVKDADRMFQAAREAGYDVSDIGDFLNKMDEEIRNGDATYKTHGYLDYRDNPASLKKAMRSRTKNPSNTKVVCQHCGHRFILTGSEECPKCGGWDIETVGADKVRKEAQQQHTEYLRMLGAQQRLARKPKVRVPNPSTAELNRCRKILDDEKSARRVPTITYNRNGVLVGDNDLSVRKLGTSKFAVYLKNYLLKTFATLAAAENYRRTIKGRKRNPGTGKIAAKLGREFLQTFDIDRDGDLDKSDLALLSHFDDPVRVIDDAGKMTGEIVFETSDGSVMVEWADGTKTAEKKSTLLKQNGFKSWRIRRKAARQYKKGLKYKEKASAARKKQRDLESAIENPDQRHLNEFRIAVRRLGNKSATKADIRAAIKAGTAAGYSKDEAWQIVKKAWNASAKKSPKRNPGIISMLAEIAVGTAAALDIKSRISGKSKKPQRARARATGREIVINPRKRPVKNSAAFEAFQGRPSTKAIEVTMPAGTPTRVYCLGRLWELRVKNYGNLDLKNGRFYLVADHQNRQLFIAGGRIVDPQPHLSAGQTIPLGEITHVVYETEKTHLGDAAGDPTPYIHRMGEEGGERPVLAVDKQGYGHVEGGSYEITPLGIKN